MDEEQLTKERSIYHVNNFVAIAILMLVFVRKTKLATAVQKDFLFSNNSFIIQDRNL